MGKFRDLSGQRFGRLCVIERAPDNPKRPGVTCWSCLCDCGNSLVVAGGSLASGNTKSCGCIRIELITKHGNTKHPLYETWRHMIRRCHDETNKGYRHYGARGISVCDEWRGEDGFHRFAEDMGPKPAGLTLERVDNDGPYTKENCEWATYTTQERNRRYNRLITYDGKTACLSEWAELLGLSSQALAWRINSGMPLDKALRPGLHFFRGPRSRNTVGRYTDEPTHGADKL